MNISHIKSAKIYSQLLQIVEIEELAAKIAREVKPTQVSAELKSAGTHSPSMAKQRVEEEDDYMGDLSIFLPPEASQPPKPSSRKVSKSETLSSQPSKKKPRALSRQKQQRLERERKQREEDEQTLARLDSSIPQSNIGFKMLKQMGYTPGSALGGGSGRVEPVGVQIRRSRAGIGRQDPHEEKRRREEERAERERGNEAAMMAEFGSRQKSQWRSRRVAANYKKAKGALEQLDNKEFVEPNKEEEGEECEHEEEEEEEEITEEDLEELLTKLRGEYHYCLFCGCQYESMEALLSNCPGLNEDDH